MVTVDGRKGFIASEPSGRVEAPAKRKQSRVVSRTAPKEFLALAVLPNVDLILEPSSKPYNPSVCGTFQITGPSHVDKRCTHSLCTFSVQPAYTHCTLAARTVQSACSRRACRCMRPLTRLHTYLNARPRRPNDRTRSAHAIGHSVHHNKSIIMRIGSRRSEDRARRARVQDSRARYSIVVIRMYSLF